MRITLPYIHTTSEMTARLLELILACEVGELFGIVGRSIVADKFHGDPMIGNVALELFYDLFGIFLF